jgi:hypothetical protein
MDWAEAQDRTEDEVSEALASCQKPGMCGLTHKA